MGDHYEWDAAESDSAWATYRLVYLLCKLKVGYTHVKMTGGTWEMDDVTMTIRYKYPVRSGI